MCVCVCVRLSGGRRPGGPGRPAGRQRTTGDQGRKGLDAKTQQLMQCGRLYCGRLTVSEVCVSMFSGKAPWVVVVVLLMSCALQGSPGFGVPGLQGPKGENGERVSHPEIFFCDVWVGRCGCGCVTCVGVRLCSFDVSVCVCACIILMQTNHNLLTYFLLLREMLVYRGSQGKR